MNELQQEEVAYSKIEEAYQIVGKKWVCLIIGSLMDVPKRFSEINTIIPELSKRVLTERLKELEDYGIVLRNVSTDRPVRSEYSLTNKGYDLGVALKRVESWAEKWL
jgi:DNA-binding HxlR family transcriptional regulator